MVRFAQVRLCLSALLVWVPSAVFAQSIVDDARTLLEGGQFEAALAELEQLANQETGLTRAEVVMLLELRAMAQHALGDREALRISLEGLGSLDRDHQWPLSTPPALRSAFEAVRGELTGPLRLEITATLLVAGQAKIAARIEGDAGQLARRVVLATRGEDGRWTEREGTEILATFSGPTLKYRGWAVGPGGAELAIAGTREAPLEVVTPALTVSAAAIADDETEGDRSIVQERERPTKDRRSKPWLWVGLSAGVVAAAGAVLSVVLLTREDRVRVRPPTFDFPAP